MPKLHLHLLGSPKVEIDGQTADIQRRKASALLVYLAVTRQVQQRDNLAALFWPDESQRKARAALARHLSELRKVIGVESVTADRETVALTSDVWLDVHHFQELVAECRDHNSDCVGLLETAVSLYHNDFLAGFTLPDCPDFDEWQFFQTEELRQSLATALAQLIQIHTQQNDYAAALPYARRQIAIDPLAESAHRTLMHLYAMSGQQTAALRQYDLCVETLDNELGVEPDSETTTLYERIRSGEFRNVPAVSTPNSLLASSQLERPKHNLPQRLTSFIGRENEMEAISHLIAENRLVNLTGVGGIGKTNLSLQVGQDSLDTFPDGVWFVELAAIHDPNLIPQATATALGLRESGKHSISEALLDHLQERACLLILDNCEHLIAGVAQFVQTVLQQCVGVKILASSREVMGVAGERPFLVPPLTLPRKKQQAIIENWQHYEALRLFVERTQIVLPNFQVTADNVASLVQICQRLDGIPLALELAAARMKLLTTSQIADRIDDRFRLLTSGSRAALPRQQTLRALVDWSWELLTDSERLLLRRLSVFVGRITLAAIETVCAGDDLESYELLDLLHELVNKSLVISQREQGQETDYFLLETIRQYAQEKLTEAGEAETFQQGHLAYYRDFAETAAAYLKGPDLLPWLNQLEDALDNIRIALDWAQATNTADGLRLIFALTEFCWLRGNIREMEARLGQLLAQPVSLPPLVEANGIWLQGWFIGILYLHSPSIQLLEKSLAIYRELGDQAGEASALMEIGHQWDLSGDLEKSHEYLQAAISLWRSLGDKVGTAWSLMSFGEGEMKWGRIEQARAYFQESVSLFREAGNLSRIFVALLRSATLATEQGDFETAVPFFEENLAIMESLGINGFLAHVLQHLGQHYFQLGDYAQAQTTFEKALVISKETESYAFSYDWALVRLGYAHLRGGNLAQAKQIFSESLQRFRKLNDMIGVVYTVEGLASLAVEEGRGETAIRLFAWADMMRQIEGNGRSPTEQEAVDRDINHLSNMLDKDAYTTAHAAGQSMTMAQVIALGGYDPD